MNSPAIILKWLKDAGTYAVERDEFVRQIDLLVSDLTVSARVGHRDQRKFNSLTWSEPERAESNPLVKLIDDTIKAVRTAE